jgi:hypothetical protein
MSFPDPLIALMGHGSAASTLRGVIPTWQKFGKLLLVVSPKDNPVEPWQGDDRYSPPQYLTAGLQEHFGIRAHARMKEYLNIFQHFLVEKGCDSLYVCEYDSLVLGNYLPFEGTEENCMRAFEVIEEDPTTGKHFQGFMAARYYHGPWWFSRVAFLAFNTEFQRLPADCERGLVDRTIGLAVERSGIKVCPSNDIHFTANFISHDMVLGLLHCVNAGAVIIHGFKNEHRKGIL